MTAQQYQERLKELIATAQTRAGESVFVPAANGLLARIKNRISRDGENSAGSTIGQYSTKPMYATQQQFIKKSAFKPQGKKTVTGNKGERIKAKRQGKIEISGKKYIIKSAKGDSANIRGSMYLPGGYKELRNIQGRPVDKINFTYSGDLLLSYVSEVKPTNILLGLNKESEAKKRKGLEKRFGKVFYATKAELDLYNKEVIEETEKLTKKILSA